MINRSLRLTEPQTHKSTQTLRNRQRGRQKWRTEDEDKFPLQKVRNMPLSTTNTLRHFSGPDTIHRTLSTNFSSTAVLFSLATQDVVKFSHCLYSARAPNLLIYGHVAILTNSPAFKGMPVSCAGDGFSQSEHGSR